MVRGRLWRTGQQEIIPIGNGGEVGSYSPRFLSQTSPVFKMSEEKRVRAGMEG